MLKLRSAGCPKRDSVVPVVPVTRPAAMQLSVHDVSHVASRFRLTQSEGVHCVAHESRHPAFLHASTHPYSHASISLRRQPYGGAIDGHAGIANFPKNAVSQVSSHER